MYSVSPVIQAESEDAKKTTAGAMSCGCPIQPSGISASVYLRPSLENPCGVCTLRFHHARIDGIDADVARTQLFGKRLCDGINRCFGRAIDRGVRGCQRANNGTNVDNATALFAKVLYGLL